MKITLEIEFYPDMSHVAFITCRTRDGRADRPLIQHRRVPAMESLDELEEVVCALVSVPLLSAQRGQPVHLWNEN